MKKDPDQNSTDSAEIEALITRLERGQLRDEECPCGNADTVGEPSKQRTYAFHSTDFKGLAQLKLNSPTVSMRHG